MFFRTFQALEALQAGLAPTSLLGSLPRLVLTDELLRAGNERLLLLVLLKPPRHPLLAQLQVAGVGGGIVLEATEGEIEGAGRDAVEEVAVVGDDQAGAGPSSQEAFQPLQHLQIEVVGRLVEEEQIRVGEEGLGEGNAGLLAAAEAVDRLGELSFGEAEAHQNLIGAVLDVVAAGGLEAGLEAVVLREQRFQLGSGRRTHCRLDLPHSIGRGKNRCERQACFLADRAIAGETRFLRQVGDAQARGVDDAPGVRVLQAGDDAEDGRFAGAIDADEGDVLALAQLEGDTGEDLVRNVRLGEIGDGKDCGRGHG